MLGVNRVTNLHRRLENWGLGRSNDCWGEHSWDCKVLIIHSSTIAISPSPDSILKRWWSMTTTSEPQSLPYNQEHHSNTGSVTHLVQRCSEINSCSWGTTHMVTGCHGRDIFPQEYIQVPMVLRWTIFQMYQRGSPLHETLNCPLRKK